MDERFKLDNQLCFRLYSASRLMTQAYTPLLSEHGLTYPQYLVLMVLWEKEEVSSRELAECLHLDYGTLTPVLKRLSQAGYLRRERSEEDERLLTLTLTDAGRELREKAVAIPPAVAKCMGLTAEEFGTLYTLAYKALKNMEERNE